MFNFDQYEEWKAAELKEAARALSVQLYPVWFSSSKVTEEVNEALSVLGYLIDQVENIKLFNNSVAWKKYKVFLDSLLVVIKAVRDNNYTMSMTKMLEEAGTITENIYGRI